MLSAKWQLGAIKITGLRTRRINIPFDWPIGTSIHRIGGVSGLLVWLDVDGDPAAAAHPRLAAVSRERWTRLMASIGASKSRRK